MARVLFAEDDAAFRANMAAWLARAGHEVVQAADGAEAAARLREAPFAVLLTDLRMPGLDGMALLDLALAERPGIQVVVLTGHGDLETAIAALRQGRAYDYVLKPLTDLPAFAEVIRGAAAQAATAAPDPEALALPPQDQAILKLAGEGLDYRTIAERLVISERTVRNRMSALFDRLGVANRTQAVLWGQARGLI